MGVMKKLAMSGHRSGRHGRSSFIEVEWFFDSPKVLRAVDQATRKVLSKFGAYVRRTARQSIRRPRRKPRPQWTRWDHMRFRKTGRKPLAPSRPGEPPRNQTGKLRDNIFFWYDPDERSVSIGPGLFQRNRDVPGLLEHGGHTRRGVLAARPYMGPALKEELPKLPALWHNSVGTRVS